MREYEEFRAALMEECAQLLGGKIDREIEKLSEAELNDIGLSFSALKAIAKLTGRAQLDTIGYALTRYHEWAQVFTVDSYEDIR